ncbi:probable cysteine--tRNA ligase, mitochondrial isoform X2 [Onychostoma macrolepis]|uniref:probable cysteine--tRNA ligase, mitochondrial isoform X2 n=1 Tax=Onychostoma macrolepis TaxID=369639 RepID=UPI00272C2FC3|nr:probable cysteine--tRNA ligase, mitochondrial isoform X2 [Onychostoma macrolepis]
MKMRLPLALIANVRLLNSGFRIRHSIHNGVTKTALLSSHNICSRAERKWIKPAGFDTGVKTYNSLTKQKEPLVLAQERIATWYSCGPTVYDHAHLGHACSYVRFDILQRILSRIFEINVIHVMVITDIDDKIIQRSLEQNISPTVLARMHEEEFKRDMQALRVLPPAVYMRVTDNIPQIVAFIERIIGNGHAYVTSQGSQDKRDPRDFALWKAFKPHEPHWESPWGQGRPGWHIECSTIASSVFGSQLDIHSGGIDLAFPHHENEIAQSEAYHQCEQWGNYFLHSGHLHLKGSVEKMSKSLKNYVTIKDFLKSYTANEFRLFCLLTRYRSAIDYSDASMNEARSTLSTISAFCHNVQAYMQGHLQCQPIEEGILWERLSATQSSIRKALADDFDTPKAVDAIMSLIHHGNCQLQPATKVDGPRSPAVFGAMLSYVREIMGVFGVDLLDRKEVHDSSGVLNNVVEELVHFRIKVRKFALSVEDQAPQDPQTGSEIQKRHPQPDRVPLLKACDALRNNLAPLGVYIKDRGTNSTWEITRGETRKN